MIDSTIKHYTENPELRFKERAELEAQEEEAQRGGAAAPGGKKSGGKKKAKRQRVQSKGRR